jgi:hypothetical protein
MAKPRNRIVEAGSKANIRKTTIELAEEQCFLKETLTRDLVEKAPQE